MTCHSFTTPLSPTPGILLRPPIPLTMLDACPPPATPPCFAMSKNVECPSRPTNNPLPSSSSRTHLCFFAYFTTTRRPIKSYKTHVSSFMTNMTLTNFLCFILSFILWCASQWYCVARGAYRVSFFEFPCRLVGNVYPPTSALRQAAFKLKVRDDQHLHIAILMNVYEFLGFVPW